MTTKYGMFKDFDYKLRPSSEGAVRQKVVFDSTGGGDRDKGLSLKATVGKTGKNNDATFDKFKRLTEGNKFVDPKRMELQAQVAQRAANITDLPFKQPAPMKKSVGAGDFYGTLAGKLKYEPHDNPANKKKKGDIPEVPRGIYTNPAKKGTFGMNKFTLSERKGFKGVATEYEYQHDPLADQKARRMAAIEEHHKACVTDLPFKPANPPKKGGFGVPNTTISKGKGVAGEWEYLLGAGPVKPGSAPAAIGEAGTPPKEELVPFRPSNAFIFKRMNKIDYIHDPEAPKLKAAHDRKVEESKRIAAIGDWRPNRGPKTDMVRSIVRMNIPR